MVSKRVYSQLFGTYAKGEALKKADRIATRPGKRDLISRG